MSLTNSNSRASGFSPFGKFVIAVAMGAACILGCKLLGSRLPGVSSTQPVPAAKPDAQSLAVMGKYRSAFDDDAPQSSSKPPTAPAEGGSR